MCNVHGQICQWNFGRLRASPTASFNECLDIACYVMYSLYTVKQEAIKFVLLMFISSSTAAYNFRWVGISDLYAPLTGGSFLSLVLGQPWPIGHV